MRYSIIVPVYKNESSIHRLIKALNEISSKLNGNLEVIFVVDGSPDTSFEKLQFGFREMIFPAQLIGHSKNFGSFSAIRTGLAASSGLYLGVMAADLQEPSNLLIEFFDSLENNLCDVVVGVRQGRNDSFLTKVTSGFFWWIYRRFVVPEMPNGGVDVFGCNRIFCNELLKLQESRTSLIALIFWLGFRRNYVGYERLKRLEGRSSWTLRKKIDYLSDSIFAFTDLPIRLLLRAGFFGSVFSLVLTLIVLISYISGNIHVPGYVPTILIVLFFGMSNMLCLGLIGAYAWRSYENTKDRPLSITSIRLKNDIKL